MPQRPGTLTVSCCHSPGLLPLGVARKVGLRTGAPPSTPTRGVPSGHLGGERSPILAHWLHHDGYGGGQPLVVHLRREEEVISADDGHVPRAGAARKRVRSASRPRTWEPGGWPEGVGHLHVLEAPSRIRKPSRERRRESLAGSARTAHGEGPVFAQRVFLASHRGTLHFALPTSAFLLPHSLFPLHFAPHTRTRAALE